MVPIHTRSATARSAEKRAVEKAIRSISQQMLRHWRSTGKRISKPTRLYSHPTKDRATITDSSAGAAAATSGPGTVPGRNCYIQWPVLLIPTYPNLPTTHILCLTTSRTGLRPSPRPMTFVSVNIPTSRLLSGTNAYQTLNRTHIAPIPNQQLDRMSVLKLVRSIKVVH